MLAGSGKEEDWEPQRTKQTDPPRAGTAKTTSARTAAAISATVNLIASLLHGNDRSETADGQTTKPINCSGRAVITSLMLRSKKKAEELDAAFVPVGTV